MVSTTTPRGNNIDMAAVTKWKKQADKTTNNRSRWLVSPHVPCFTDEGHAF